LGKPPSLIFAIETAQKIRTPQKTSSENRIRGTGLLPGSTRPANE
jgi:hypothetical protein